jgi:hypothetical protein
VEYDKTNQNLSQLGIVQFAMQEPARFAVSGDKCFYFQHDHWTGSIVQGQAPELWHWDGSYYWDKARGTGATYFANMRTGGYGDWAPILPLLPPDMRRYAHPTGWGAVFYSRYPVDKRCAAMVDTPEKAARVYRQPARPKPAPAARCAGARGRVRGRRLGELTLGMRRSDVERVLGDPTAVRRGISRYCLDRGGELRVGYHHGQVPLLLTTSPAYAVHGVRAGSAAASIRKRLHGARLAFKIGSTRVYEVAPRRDARLLVGARGRTVAYLAIADPAAIATRPAAQRWLARAG